MLAASTGDLPSEDDNLGFEPYVQALAEFLLNPSTHGPLTVSVEGEWGSGKSSFMLQLQDRLTNIGDAPGPARRLRTPLTVWFNAWRHDKDEALWAAFATEFTRRIAEEQNIRRRLWGHMVLLWRRFTWREGWLDLLRAVVLWTTVFILATLLFALAWLKGAGGVATFVTTLSRPGALNATAWASLTKGLARAGWVGGALAYFTLLLAGLIKLKQYVGNPLAIDLKKYIAQPDYAARISFVEKFHKDFSRIVDAYAGDKTVYVFIDDLDRCEVPRAAELMQALNLMMSTDRRGLIFIIGMDRAKVAAGLAVKNEKLLPYLYASAMGPNADTSHIDPQLGLAFGYNFIEKFIQIPFLVPSPAPDNVQQFFDKLAKPELAAPSSSALQRAQEAIMAWFLGQQRMLIRKLRAREVARQREATITEGLPADAGSAPTTPAAVAVRRENFKLAVTGDSPTVRNIVLSVAPVLGNNPRRMKQFVNLFRLRTFIAAETGLFDGDDGLTLRQLGKFVALNLRWPLLLVDLEREPRMLEILTRVAVDADVPSKLSDAANRWRSDPALTELLKSTMMSGDEGAAPLSATPAELAGWRTWSLIGVDVRKLLRVAPRVHTISLDRGAGGRPAPVPVTQSAPPTADAPAAETPGTVTAEDFAEAPAASEPPSQGQQRRVTLVADAADFTQVQRLQKELASRGIYATTVQGHLAGSNLVVKLEPNMEDSTILFCLGAGVIQMAGESPDYINRAIGEHRIPVIMESIEGGDLNYAFRERMYFDIREPGGFEKLVRYLTDGTFTRPEPPSKFTAQAT